MIMARQGGSIIKIMIGHIDDGRKMEMLTDLPLACQCSSLTYGLCYGKGGPYYHDDGMVHNDEASVDLAAGVD